MWPFLIPAAAQTTTSLLQYFMRKKPPRYEETARGKYLKGRSRYGKYTPQARRSILGGVSRRTGGVAQQEKASIRGLLTSRGMGDSIAGIRLLSEPEIKRMAILGGAEERLGIESELSKGRAREAFATEKTGYGEQRRMEESQARGGLLQGLVGAGTRAYQGYQLGTLADKHPELASLLQSGANVPYYAYRDLLGKKKQPFALPPNFTELSETEIFELAKNSGFNYEDLLAYQYDQRAKLVGEPEGPIRRLER